MNNPSDSIRDIKNIIGNFMLSTEELMLTMDMSQSAFSRFAKKANMKPSRTIKKRNFYHVSVFEDAVKEQTRAFQTVELIESTKKIMENENG